MDRAALNRKGMDMATTDPKTVKGDDNLAVIGDNGMDEVEAEAFDRAMRKMIGLNAQRKALAATIAKARKEMKADGIELGKLDATIKLMEWTPAEIREHFATTMRYARYAKLPVGEQIDLLAHADDDEVSAEDWKWRGYSAAVTGNGVPGVPPDTCPEDRHQDWLAGWNDGQIANAPKQLEPVE